MGLGPSGGEPRLAPNFAWEPKNQGDGQSALFGIPVSTLLIWGPSVASRRKDMFQSSLLVLPGCSNVDELGAALAFRPSVHV